MNAYEFNTVNEMYSNMVKALLDEKSSNGTRELRNVLLTIKDISNPVITLRGTSIPYLCGELLWYITGTNDVNFISKFAKKWSEITDDGWTSNSAYGYVLQTKHGFNQIDKMVELLKTDKNSRRAVMNLNTPNERVIETKDEICTIALQFLLRENKLHCTAIMRSNDVYTGMPYDIAYFASLQKIIAHRLGVECGTYTHFVTSLHLYDSCEEKLRDALTKNFDDIRIDSLKLLELNHDDYERINNSTSPKTEVVELFKEKEILLEDI